MRTIKTSASLLTPYQQAQKDKAAESKPAEVEATREEVLEPMEPIVVRPVVEPYKVETEAASIEPIEPIESIESIAPKIPRRFKPAPKEAAGMHPEEIKLLDSIYRIEKQLIDLREEESAASAELERVTLELREATETKMAIMKSLPESLIRIRDGATVAANVVSEAKQVAADAVKPEEWHQQDTMTFLAGIAGLGPQKLKRLASIHPKLSDLQNCRIQAGAKFTSFAEQLPHGIGAAIADQIAERLIQAETEHGTPSVAEQVKQSQAEILEARAKEESKENAEKATEARKRKINLIAKSLKTSTDAAFVVASTTMTKGKRARAEGLEITTCPETDDSEIADWLKGWIEADNAARAAKAEAKAEAEDTPIGLGAAIDRAIDQAPFDVEPAPVEPAPVEPAPGSSVDHESNVNKIADALRAAGDLRRVSGNEHWSEGLEAATVDDFPIEACPGNLKPDDQRQWVAGWLFGQASLLVGL